MRLMVATVLVGTVLLAGCAPDVNSLALKVGQPPEATLKLRNLQTRRFDSGDDKAVMAAGIQTLQDLGFTITESAPEAGVVVATKQRDAEESGQIAGQVALSVMMALLGSSHNPVWDKEQTIQVTLVTMPIVNAAKMDVRVSFDRILTNNHGNVWRAEFLHDPKLYQEFFQRLSQSVFLEAHEI